MAQHSALSIPRFIRSLLVVKLADMGDVLTATPAIRALRDALPNARLEALLTPDGARLLEGWDALTSVRTFPKADFDRPRDGLAGLPRALALSAGLRGRYDAVVLLHHLTTAWGTLKYAALMLASGAPVRAGLDNGRGWFLTHRVEDNGFGAKHEVEYGLSLAALLGASITDRRMEVPVGAEAKAWARQRWRELGLDGERAAMLHPGSGGFSLARRWPAERFAQVGDALMEERVERVLLLAGPGPGETELARSVAAAMARPATVVTDAPGPQALAALISHCRLFVGNDSGVMHLAAAVGVPTVAIFGPSNDRAWGPYPSTSGRIEVVREQLACSPCIYVGHRLGTPQGCAARTCLDLIEPAAVAEAARRALSGVVA